MIRAVIFDCFGVLFSDGKAIVDSYAPADRADELRDLYMQSDYGYITRQEFLDGMTDLTGLSEEELQEIVSDTYKRNEPLIARIKQLRQHYKIAMLSNVGNDFIQSLFTQQELDELFDAVLLSSTIGVVKPNAEAYQMTAEALGVHLDECLFIDDRQPNVDGAKLAGMEAMLFTTNQQINAELEARLSNNA